MSVRDVKLSEFSGNNDTETNHINTKYFLPLIRWIKEARAILTNCEKSEADGIIGCSKTSQCAACTAFLARFSTIDRAKWCLSDAFDAVASLIPDYKIRSTREALDMSFYIDSLIDDINSFPMYVSSGAIEENGNQTLFSELQKTILDACPTFLPGGGSAQRWLYVEFSTNVQVTC